MAEPAGMFDLSGQVAVVTGARRGIGRGVSVALIRADAAVFLASRASDYVDGHLLAVDGGWLGR